MLSVRGRWALASAPILLLLIGSTAIADEAQTRAALARLLDVGWSVTPQARAAADAQYQEVLKIAGRDPRALTASWLVLMQQRRFEEARQRLDEYLAGSPADLKAQRAKTWVLAVLKNYPAAMLAADKLSAQVAASPAGDELNRVAQDELIAFLGRLVGYWGGPAADAVNQDERKALEKKLLDRLDESRKLVFEDARNGVLSKYIEITDDSIEARQRAAAAAVADKEKTLAELQADREKIAARSKELEDRKGKVRDAFNEELAEIAKQDQPLVQELTRLNSRASSLDGTLFVYQSEIDRLQRQAASEKSNALKQQYLFQADQVALLAAQVSSDLLATNRLLQGVQNQRGALAQRQAQAQSDSANQIDKIERELESLAKRERRNDGLEKRAARPVSASTGKTRSLSAQAMALSTYDAFPLEAAKAELLEALR